MHAREWYLAIYNIILPIRWIDEFIHYPLLPCYRHLKFSFSENLAFLLFNYWGVHLFKMILPMGGFAMRTLASRVLASRVLATGTLALRVLALRILTSSVLTMRILTSSVLAPPLALPLLASPLQPIQTQLYLAGWVPRLRSCAPRLRSSALPPRSDDVLQR